MLKGWRFLSLILAHRVTLWVACVIVIWSAIVPTYPSPDQPYEGNLGELKFIKVKVIYKNPYFFTEEGLAGYYIGLPMSYELQLINTGPQAYNDLIITAIHEYYTSGTCQRWWYPYPLEAEYRKGEALPGDSSKTWEQVNVGPYETITLSGSFTSTNETCSGLDQTHVIIKQVSCAGFDVAVLVGGSLKISGTTNIQGTNGSVQANGNIMIEGTPTIAQDVISAGTVTISGTPIIGGTIFEGAPVREIPVINPTDYKPLADYILKTNGRAYDREGNLLGESPFRGWGYSSYYNKWTLPGNTGYDGTYYVEGNAEISGNPGETAETPWRVTLLADGYISISGQPVMIPDSEGVLFMARGDISISGSPDLLYEGMIAAHEQIKITGTPQIYGVIVAEDAVDYCSLVSTHYSEFDVQLVGNASITYNKQYQVVYDEPEAGVFCPPPPSTDTIAGSSGIGQGKTITKCGCVGLEALFVIFIIALLRKRLSYFSL